MTVPARNLADDKSKTFYVDGDAHMKCTVVDHIAAQPELYVVLLNEGFWSVDRDRFGTYMVVHGDNLTETAG